MTQLARPQTDDQQITEIVARLRRRYPPQRISSPDLEQLVDGFYHQLSAAPIRTFVAILAERLTRASIENPAPAAGTPS
ncbi:three-helix bundle dimerization domain-containing protein [Hamadaea tsunoensis]|uniref:three-helix bundle dimerization domain-containing protein n=1 Tax=Hamadaea tsunoensis TaxID=53368 RepID=UPI0012FC69CA|nr:hypothetical protein [Hamadaea tsunoensis]